MGQKPQRLLIPWLSIRKQPAPNRRFGCSGLRQKNSCPGLKALYVKQVALRRFKKENKVVALEEEARSAVADCADLQDKLLQLRLNLQMQKHSPH